MGILKTHTFTVTLTDSLLHKHRVSFETEVIDVKTDEERLKLELNSLLSPFGVVVLLVEQMVQ